MVFVLFLGIDSRLVKDAEMKTTRGVPGKAVSADRIEEADNCMSDEVSKTSVQVDKIIHSSRSYIFCAKKGHTKNRYFEKILDTNGGAAKQQSTTAVPCMES